MVRRWSRRLLSPTSMAKTADLRLYSSVVLFWRTSASISTSFLFVYLAFDMLTVRLGPFRSKAEGVKG